MTSPSFAASRRDVLVGASAFALAGLAPAMAAPRRGGVLKVSTRGLDTSDPHRHTGSVVVQQAYAEGLTSIAADGTLEPFLAQSIEISDAGRIVAFRLREGVLFHDGTKMTSAEVGANFVRMRDQIGRGTLSAPIQQTESLETPDARTVVFRLREPYSPLLNLFSEFWVLSPNSPGWNGTITKPIGTGPFVFGAWTPNASLTATRFDRYWQEGRPYVDAVAFDLREDADHSVALRAGDTHIARVRRERVAALSRDPAISLGKLGDSTWYFLAFNNRNPRPPFNDLRVRRAVAHALDKRGFMNFVAGADGVPGNQMVLPAHPNFNPDQAAVDPYRAPDLAKAKALLAEAGVEPEKVTVEAISWQQAYAQIPVQMVAQLGFKVNHQALDDVGAQRRAERYDWDIAVFSSGPRPDVFLRFVRLMSDGPNPTLWGGIQDAEMDAIVRAAVAEPDVVKRKALYTRAYQRVLDRHYFVVLGHSQEIIAWQRSVQGFQPGFTWSPNWASGGIAHAWLAAQG